jgi:hypothetical protein
MKFPPPPLHDHQKPGSGTRFVISDSTNTYCKIVHKKYKLWQSGFRFWILPSSSKSKKKSLDFYFFVTSLRLFSFKDVNEPSKSKKQTKLYGKNFLVGVLKVTDEKSLIWIRSSEVRIRGRGSVPKCHRSGTLLWQLP